MVIEDLYSVKLATAVALFAEGVNVVEALVAVPNVPFDEDHLSHAKPLLGLPATTFTEFPVFTSVADIVGYPVLAAADGLADALRPVYALENFAVTVVASIPQYSYGLSVDNSVLPLYQPSKM